MSGQFCTQCGESLASDDRFCRGCGTAVARETSPKTTERYVSASFRPVPWLLVILLIVGGTLIALGLFWYQVNQPSVVDVPDDHDASGLPYPNVPRISVAETLERFGRETAVIVDVRSVQEYAEGHIPNALSIPLDELQTRYVEIPQEAEIITYCT